MKEITMIFLKPDAMENEAKMNGIFDRLIMEGFEVVHSKAYRMTDSDYDEHYGHLKNCDFYEDMRKFITSRSLIFAILKGENAVQRVRELIGPTRNAPPGTIRGDFGSDGFKNLIHASDSYESVVKELARFFYQYYIE